MLFPESHLGLDISPKKHWDQGICQSLSKSQPLSQILSGVHCHSQGYSGAQGQLRFLLSLRTFPRITVVPRAFLRVLLVSLPFHTLSEAIVFPAYTDDQGLPQSLRDTQDLLHDIRGAQGLLFCQCDSWPTLESQEGSRPSSEFQSYLETFTCSSWCPYYCPVLKRCYFFRVLGMLKACLRLTDARTAFLGVFVVS